MATAKSWLKRCDSNHDVCKAWGPSTTLPARLIDIGGQGRLPRLVLTSTLAARPRYTTLSHCWGTRPTLRLTVSNLTTFADCIRHEEVPKSYADAIEVTRTLGVGYIWIDSLCIIQDSIADWQRESIKMADIYMHTYCNIAALESTDSHGGCFRQRDPAVIRPLVLRTHWDGIKDELWKWSLQEYPRDIFDEIDSAPVNTRAWVLQERQLSPRTLHFGRIMLYWECRKLVSHEVQHHWCATNTAPSINRLLIYRGETDLAIFTGRAEDRGALDRWMGVVEKYTKAALTFRSDKFVAISALARETKRVMDHGTGRSFQYLAGLWKPVLEYQLMWVVTKPCLTTTSRNDGFTSPSWSWASVDGSIHFHSPRAMRHQLLALVTGHQLIPYAGDPFLGVSLGSTATLNIRGLCWRLADHLHHRILPENEMPIQLKLKWDVIVVSPRIRAPVYLLPLTIRWDAPVSPIIILGEEDDVKTATLEGLLMERVEISAMVFRRIGFFEIEISEENQDDYLNTNMKHWYYWLRKIIHIGLRDKTFGPIDVYTCTPADRSIVQASNWNRAIASHNITLE